MEVDIYMDDNGSNERSETQWNLRLTNTVPPIAKELQSCCVQLLIRAFGYFANG